MIGLIGWLCAISGTVHLYLLLAVEAPFGYSAELLPFLCSAFYRHKGLTGKVCVLDNKFYLVEQER